MNEINLEEYCINEDDIPLYQKGKFKLCIYTMFECDEKDVWKKADEILEENACPHFRDVIYTITDKNGNKTYYLGCGRK